MSQEPSTSNAYYVVVKNGRSCGICDSWDQCKSLISNATFKKFKTLADAEKFSNGLLRKESNAVKIEKPVPFYAVRVGRKPGIYRNWPECFKQVDGFKGSKFRKFPTLEEATNFMNGVNSFEKKDVEIVLVSSLDPSLGNAQMKRKCEERNGDPFAAKRFKTPQMRQQRQMELIQFENLPGQEEGIVYTDGACEKNGKKGSKGGIGVYWGPNHPLNVSEPLEGRQTNNRAEIMAAVTALRQAKSIGLKRVTVCTDSKFLIDGITSWIYKWKTNGWKLSTNEPVKNKEDFEALDEARNGLDVRFEHVRGHRGILGNEAADKLARDGVR